MQIPAQRPDSLQPDMQTHQRTLYWRGKTPITHVAKGHQALVPAPGSADAEQPQAVGERLCPALAAVDQFQA
ncbi:hypothetical protein D3C76_1729260 [compost metagenome]